MANSSLVIYERNNPDKCNERDHAIDRITIHCYVGQVTAQQGVDYLVDTERQASVNYVVGIDGIGAMIPEEYRAWTSSSWDNDRRAITIETACDTNYPYTVNDDVLAREIDLVEDIMRRYGKTHIVWIDDKDAALNYEPADNEMLMTVHRWFAATACPGDYLMEKMEYIANEVNNRLAASNDDTYKFNPKDYDNEEFINKIARVVVDIKDNYDIKVASPIIAQACLESAYGKTHKASYYNFFGLKYRENRVKCHCGYFNDDSVEQEPDGTIVPCNDNWYAFDSFETGVQGYFEYLAYAGGRYDNLKGVTDPYTYLTNIKADGYATSIEYVDNVYRCLMNNNLTRFDSLNPGDPLPEVKKELYRVRTSWDDPSSQIGAYEILENAINACPEGYKVYNSEGIEVYPNAEPVTPTPAEEEMYRVRKSWEDAASQIGAYRIYQNAINACIPGYTVYNSKGEAVYTNEAKAPYYYRVRKSWEDAASQIGAYEILDNAINACIEGYSVYNEEGEVVYSNIVISVDIDEIARQVINGDWGNGQERRDRLTEAGYDYAEVQTRVNEMMLNSYDVDEIAKQVIRGDWGNGQERRERLAAAGYDYDTIQNRVNQMLG